MEKTNLICITCPIGCHLEVTKTSESGWLVEGNECKRGQIYAKKELTAPTRILTSTVKVEGSANRLLPVKTKGAIPKEKILEAMEVINKTTVKTPVMTGDVVVKNILDEGIDVVATKSLVIWKGLDVVKIRNY